ncbi:hypothetical protein IV57_GL001246 [Companilactobacillus kimchiensis]|uniref:Prepilin peptidase A24 N-terminal domain-containing protein n=2 Tax=Companilactobacillus kimchiensis TaxID=993692 RepID=A0A0R2LE70_9LACO|nr:hypothetical protein IV57_GL001246 [Companilactobacillus kimchiensis]
MAYVSSFIFNKQTNIAANKSTSIKIPSKKSHVNATFSKSYPQCPVILLEVIEMKFFLSIIFFILGACIISFLKVIAHDYPHLSVTRRSHCDHCRRILEWFEIIPIIGYFVVHGKCFSCKKQIDFFNPLQELLGGLFFSWIAHLDDWFYWPFFIMLILLGFMDYYYGYIYPIFYLLSLPTLILIYPRLHLTLALLTYLILFLLSKRYLFGLGDIEVLTIISLIFGYQLFLNIVILACLLCIGVYLTNKKRSFRFIPYLTTATGIIYLIFSIKT